METHPFAAIRRCEFSVFSSLPGRGDYALLVSCLCSPQRLVRLGAVESLRMTNHPELERVLALRALDETDEEVLQALNC